jgi:hypothetical protein
MQLKRENGAKFLSMKYIVDGVGYQGLAIKLYGGRVLLALFGHQNPNMPA